MVIWGELDEGFAGADEEVATSPAPRPLDVWRRWADRVDGQGIASGHFIAEEAPRDLVEALAPFLSSTGG
jgi:hypothetical protein